MIAQPGRKMSQPKIGIVLVNLNCYQDTAVCIRSLNKINYTDYDIILVDNGSTDGSGDKLHAEFPNVVYLRSERNLGFTGGNNLGIEAALKREAGHVLLLNNDTIVTPDFLKALVNRLAVDPTAAAVSGKIYYAPERMEGRDNIIWYAGCFQKWHTGYHHTGVMEADEGKFETARQVPYASGCMMLMRGSVIREQGPLSDEFFIYWEEADWCHRAREKGYTCWYEPKSVIYHNFTNAPRGGEKPFYMYMQTRNAFLYARRHYRGLKKLRYFMFYPIYLFYNYLYLRRARNKRGARAIVWGVIDYFRGLRGENGLRERGFLPI